MELRGQVSSLLKEGLCHVLNTECKPLIQRELQTIMTTAERQTELYLSPSKRTEANTGKV